MNILIEVTRQCNLKCDHCLRGEPENKTIKKDDADLLFSQLEEINLLTLTGGEPALWPSKIEMILATAKKYKVDIRNFYVATNGTISSDAFILSLIKLWLYCSENELSCLSISNDSFHDMDLIKENTKKFQVLSFARYQNQPRGFCYDTNIEQDRFPDFVEDYHDYDSEYIINQGRGRDWGDKEPYSMTFDDLKENPDDAEFYLNCNGDIILGCDWSYEEQEEHKLCHVSGFGSYLKQINMKE